MTAIKFVLLLAGFSVAAPIKAAPDDVTINLAEAPVTDILKTYELVSGKKVAAPGDVTAERKLVSVKLRKKSKDEALTIIKEALEKQARIEIVHAADGSLSARKMIPAK
jgi:hypothetical protein